MPGFRAALDAGLGTLAVGCFRALEVQDRERCVIGRMKLLAKTGKPYISGEKENQSVAAPRDRLHQDAID